MKTIPSVCVPEVLIECDPRIGSQCYCHTQANWPSVSFDQEFCHCIMGDCTCISWGWRPVRVHSTEQRRTGTCLNGADRERYVTHTQCKHTHTSADVLPAYITVTKRLWNKFQTFFFFFFGIFDSWLRHQHDTEHASRNIFCTVYSPLIAAVWCFHWNRASSSPEAGSERDFLCGKRGGAVLPGRRLHAA